MAHRAHHRPVSQPSEKFERRVGGEDPAARDEAAHTSARILLERGRQNSDPEIAARLIGFTDEYGIEALAQLWSHSPARSLPGALWRMYSLRDMVRRYPKATAQAFSTGMGADYRSHLLAGVPDPPGASEVVKTADKILAGLYSGDIDIALERFAAFARVVALGLRLNYERADISRLSGNPQGVHPPSHEVRREGIERMFRVPEQYRKLVKIAEDLEATAAHWRASGGLEALYPRTVLARYQIPGKYRIRN